MTRGDLVKVFGRIGCLSFGGPAAQIALMHKELVEDRNWLTESQFLRALSFCMLLPGPEAMQLATYAGWRLKGIPGGLIAGLLFVLPGAVVIMALALAYSAYGNQTWVQGLFVGIQAAVVVIVVAALRKVSAKALHGRVAALIATAAFLALVVFGVPFPLVILLAAVVGALTLAKPSEIVPSTTLRFAAPAKIIAVGAILWAAPILLLWAQGADFLLAVALFFSKLAIVTFGGAYAVLAYMTQQVVGELGWLSTPQMMDALGLAETTPGPLILVTQFVAMIAGQAQEGIWTALAAGALTLWVTFVPCFIWIFAGAPMIDWLEGQPRLQAALSGITAAIVGVIASLSLWFALHVLFSDLGSLQLGPAEILWPVFTSLRLLPLSLIALAAALMFWRKWPLLPTMLLCAGVGLIASFNN